MKADRSIRLNRRELIAGALTLIATHAGGPGGWAFSVSTSRAACVSPDGSPATKQREGMGV